MELRKFFFAGKLRDTARHPMLRHKTSLFTLRPITFLSTTFLLFQENLSTPESSETNEEDHFSGKTIGFLHGNYRCLSSLFQPRSAQKLLHTQTYLKRALAVEQNFLFPFVIFSDVTRQLGSRFSLFRKSHFAVPWHWICQIEALKLNNLTVSACSRVGPLNWLGFLALEVWVY